MTLTPEALYLQLGQLVAEMPDLANGPLTPEINRWIGRDSARGGEWRYSWHDHNLVEGARFERAPAAPMECPSNSGRRYQALAKVELAAPAPVQRTFIAAGHGFDAFAAIGKVLNTAKSDVLMIDPYADAKVLTDYTILAPEHVSVRVLAEWPYLQSLKPAAGHWAKQLGPARPLSVRLAADGTLHDRLILIDATTAWTLGQSFKDLAARAPTSLVRSDPELSALKVAAYGQMWAAATPL